MTVVSILAEDVARLDDAFARLPYESAKRLARHPDAEVRRRLASRRDTPREVLYYLAEDEDAGVRRAVACNPETPVQACVLLARDADRDVRYNVARWVAECAPAFETDDRSSLRHLFVKILKVLVKDELTLVRKALSEAIKGLASIPLEIVRSLARDPEPEVAAPVLTHSPVLRDSDLTEILRTQPAPAKISAIALREGLGPEVADAIVDTGDTQAIADLLGNESAQIREETLDTLIAGAEATSAWQAPLAGRRDLSPDLLGRLAKVLGDERLEALKRRARKIEKSAAARLAREREAGGDRDGGDEDGRPRRRSAEEEAQDTAFARARRLHAEGRLDESMISEAVLRGDRAFSIAALACKTGLPVPLVAKVVASGSAKAITALVWHAGLSMRLAVQIQMRLARVPPSQVLYARDGVGFPLTTAEMEWQLELFGVTPA